MHHFAKKKNNSPCPFDNIIQYGIDEKLLDKDFRENETLYQKTLDFD
jgi:hypothetical protein